MTARVLPVPSAALLACILHAQDAAPPPVAGKSGDADAVVETMDFAQRELRHLMLRNAELERELAELRGRHAGEVAGARRELEEARQALATLRAEVARRTAAERTRADQAEARAHAARDELVRAQQAYETLRASAADERARLVADATRSRELSERSLHEIRAENRGLQDELARLRTAMDSARKTHEEALRAATTRVEAAEASAAASAAAAEAAKTGAQSPSGGVVIRLGGSHPGERKDAVDEARPRAGASTPRRSKKID
ncbi:MAG: hypothetical protein R3F56_02190 [Planctomycetota bacterium]